MLNIEEIKLHLNAPHTNIEHVARTTGLSRMTIVRLKRGDGDALHKTIAKVSEYFEGELEAE